MEIILHCSDSTFGNATLIDSWHRQRGFKSIGYHLVILNGQIAKKKYNRFFDGLIETGRPLDDSDKFEFDETAAATLGKNDCVQICLIGKSGKFSGKQMDSLFRALYWMREIFGEIKVSQHSDYEPKKPFCAGILKEQMEQFNTLKLK